MSTPTRNPERLLLAALTTRPGLISEAHAAGVRPGSFSDANRRLATALFDLHDHDRGIDALTVTRHAGEPSAALDRMVQELPEFPQTGEYARLVVEDALWRGRHDETIARAEAVRDRDETAWDAATATVAADHEADAVWTAERHQSDLAEEYAAHGGTCFPLPWPGLERSSPGVLQPGDSTVVAAWTSHGKSIIAAQVLETQGDNGARVALYTNETTIRQMRARLLAGRAAVTRAGLTFRELTRRPHRLTAEHIALLRAEVARLPITLVDCRGWTAPRIARHLRRHSWDMACLDLFNRVPGRSGSVADVDAALGALLDAAGQSNAHLLICAQLNQSRSMTAKRPSPTSRDLRESGSLANDPANVMFVHRHQDSEGFGDDQVVQRLPEGDVWFDKLRNGDPGFIQGVVLDADRMRFDERIRVTA